MSEVLLGFLGFLGLGVACISALVWHATGAALALALLLAGVGLASWSALTFWRRDPIATAKLLLFVSVVPALVSFVWILNIPAPYGRVPWFGSAFTLVAAVCATYLWRDSRRPEVLPNVLLDWANAAQVCEIDGVQLFARLLRRQDHGLELHVAAQSCVNAERVLTVRLSGPPLSRLRYPSQSTARLGPAEVGVLVIPMQPVPGPNAPGKLFLAPDVTGPWGARVRHWRAKAFERRIDPGMQVLLLLAGHIAWGGGLSVEVPRASSDAPPPGPELAAESWQTRWQPDPGLLRHAVR
jgi:hypothetical protein